MRVILTFTSSPDDEEDPRWHDPALLPPGIRPRGRGYVYDWRDATGKTFSRKAGETIAEGLAFKARIDAELAAGTFVAGSRTTFAEYAAHWIETHPLKSQTRRGYRSVLRSDLLPYFGSTPLPKITPAIVPPLLIRSCR